MNLTNHVSWIFSLRRKIINYPIPTWVDRIFLVCEVNNPSKFLNLGRRREREDRNHNFIIMKLSFILFPYCPAELAALADVVTLGTRPYWLIDQMKPSTVKDKLGM